MFRAQQTTDRRRQTTRHCQSSVVSHRSSVVSRQSSVVRRHTHNLFLAATLFRQIGYRMTLDQLARQDVMIERMFALQRRNQYLGSQHAFFFHRLAHCR